MEVGTPRLVDVRDVGPRDRELLGLLEREPLRGGCIASPADVPLQVRRRPLRISTPALRELAKLGLGGASRAEQELVPGLRDATDRVRPAQPLLRLGRLHRPDHQLLERVLDPVRVEWDGGQLGNSARYGICGIGPAASGGPSSAAAARAVAALACGMSAAPAAARPAPMKRPRPIRTGASRRRGSWRGRPQQKLRPLPLVVLARSEPRNRKGSTGRV